RNRFEIRTKQIQQNLFDLKKSEQRFRDIALSSADFIWEVDQNGRYVYASEKVRNILGYSQNEILGKTPFDLMPKDEVKRTRKIFFDVLKKKRKITDLENWNLTKKGKKICLLTNGLPILNEKGRLIGYRGVDKDITDRKKTEEELKLAHQHLNDIIEFLPDACFVVDSERKVVAWNKAIEEMTLVKKKDILGKGSYEYAMPFYGKRRPILIDLAYLSNRELKKKYDFVRKEGNTIYGEVYVPKTYGGKGAYLAGTASLLFDENGKIAGAIEIIRDITDKKNAEELLKASEEKYKGIFQNAGEVIVLSDLTGKIMDINKAVESYRLKRKNIIGKNMSDFICKELFYQMRGDLLENLKGKPTSGETKIKTPVGMRTCYYKDTPVLKDRKIIGIQTILTDITERILAEEALKKRNQELMKKEEEIIEINRKLENLTQELVQLNNVKDNFLSSVSHELKTPLTSIKSYNQLLSDGILGGLNDKQKEAIQVVLQSTEHLNRLINDLLNVARYEEGRAEFNFVKCNFNDLISMVSKEFEPLLTSVGAVLKIKMPKSATSLSADREKLYEILRNLLSNAIKYRSKRRLTVTIALRRNDKSIVISVNDNGTGISRENMRNIFNKFYQADQGMTKRVEGTGLGLSIVKHIVEGHHGTISVKSQFGRGTKFMIILPTKQNKK
ncbi:PAS domain S-box protein, partial [Candidatus Woesearchaeota archaeon]|nr:PAS domain S-box protein [Candidatus Woesearchaeota archaeon]